MFAQIRGVPESARKQVVNRTLQDMGLSLKADARVSTYSGGNKRKLSVALSMVSDPAVSFLDEPSTGMDPKTRRGMWDYLLKMRAGRGIILTTHSMGASAEISAVRHLILGLFVLEDCCAEEADALAEFVPQPMPTSACFSGMLLTACLCAATSVSWCEGNCVRWARARASRASTGRGTRLP